jgi:hypothetical protein
MRYRRILREMSWLLLVALLAGCAARSSQIEMAPVPRSLDEGTAMRLIADWQAQLCRYIAQQGQGDDAVLTELRTLRSPTVLRPARIQFGVLGAGAAPPEQTGWDVEGVLVGTRKDGVFVRHVFAVGIVGYDGALPTTIQDIRLVALAPLAETLVWETSAADPEAVARYRETFSGPAASRFPAADDAFRMTSSQARVSVQERRSGAAWTLAVRPDLHDIRGAVVSFVRGPADESVDARCRPR